MNMMMMMIIIINIIIIPFLYHGHVIWSTQKLLKLFLNLLYFYQIKLWSLIHYINSSASYAIYNAVFDLCLLAQYSAGNAFLCNADVDAGKLPPTNTLYNWSDIIHTSYDK